MGATLLDRVNGLADVIRSHSNAMEKDRRISDEVVDGIRATGLNRALVPAALGGDDVPLLDVLDAVERIASFDGSTGWCAAIGSGSNFFSGYMARDVAAEVWVDPDRGNASMFGPFGQVRPAGEGFTMSGRWPFCSNSLHSDWIGLGSMWFADGESPEPIPRLVFVKMADVTVESTWDSPGLCGTGSHHTSVEDLAVDRARSFTFLDSSWADGPLWRLPLFTVLAPGLGIVPLGIARGAVDDVQRLISDGTGSTRGAIADDPIALADFAMADTRLRAARAALTDACGRAWDVAAQGDRISKVQQAQIVLAVNHGCEVAVEVTSTCHRLGGGAASYAGSPLLRRLRDVETARQHIMFGFGHRPMLAKALAGQDIFAPPFIV
jgi:alkylation response protein AidB-like acyl-CoA dehydrogenase